MDLMIQEDALRMQVLLTIYIDKNTDGLESVADWDIWLVTNIPRLFREIEVENVFQTQSALRLLRVDFQLYLVIFEGFI